jgi:hypothetical protein
VNPVGIFSSEEWARVRLDTLRRKSERAALGEAVDELFGIAILALGEKEARELFAERLRRPPHRPPIGRLRKVRTSGIIGKYLLANGFKRPVGGGVLRARGSAASEIRYYDEIEEPDEPVLKISPEQFAKALFKQDPVAAVKATSSNSPNALAREIRDALRLFGK